MKLQINADNAGITVFTLLRRRLGYSHTHLKSLKFGGRITVNGERVTVRYTLREGDILEADDSDRSEDAYSLITPTELPLDIVYEDGDIAVIDKPPFMPTHPSRLHMTDTLANALAYRNRGCEAYVFRPVNRLDRNTSGLVLVAKNRRSASVLSGAIASGNVTKRYAVLLEGVPEVREGTITGSIKRQPDSIIMRMMTDGDDGDYCETRYRVIASSDTASLVIASPVTGRTHQLRVSFAHIGVPIAGDDIYGGHTDVINRQALHALSLEFTHPGGASPGGVMSFFRQPPQDFMRAARLMLPDAGDIAPLIERNYVI